VGVDGLSLTEWMTMELPQDAYRLQLKLFLSEVRQQQLLSSIRSFLKLYTTISIAKLASFMDVDEPTLRYACRCALV
jgi:hypothetical protein